jgi:hypothetical protein
MNTLPQRSGTIALRSESGLLELWHLLSLDAPTVATLWTCFVAKVTHTAMTPEFPVAMFLAVWILYAADRLLDARSAAGLEARHRFHDAHRVGGLVVLARLPAVAFELYVGLAAGLGLWFVTVHRAPGRSLPKEVVTGAFFSAAIYVPFASRITLVPAILFAALCSLNCLYIHSWENAESAPAHATTGLARKFLPQISLGLILFPLVHLGPMSLAISAAAGLLALLNRFHADVEATTLRAAADLVLLTPVLVLPFLS